jgi:hypothetical protein
MHVDRLHRVTQQSLPPKGPPRRPRPEAKTVSLAQRIERAAGDINPVLAIFAIGLAILAFTCYAGLAVSRQSAAPAVAGDNRAAVSSEGAAAAPAAAGHR